MTKNTMIYYTIKNNKKTLKKMMDCETVQLEIFVKLIEKKGGVIYDTKEFTSL